MPGDDQGNVVTLRPAADKSGRAKPGTKRNRKATSPQGSTSGHQAIEAERREGQAIELRLRRYTLQQIADELGYADPSSARKAIMRGLVAEYPEAQRDQLRREEIATIDAVQRAAWNDAMLGDPKARQDVLRCVALRSKLNGLEAPQQVELSTREGEAVEINITHSLDPAFVQAAELVRSRIVEQSVLRAGEHAIDVTPTDPV